MSTNQKTISADQDRAYEALKLATLNILDVTSANTNEETKRYAIRRAEQLVTRAKKLLDPDVKKTELAEISFTCFQPVSFAPRLPSIRPGMKFSVHVKGVTDSDRLAQLDALKKALGMPASDEDISDAEYWKRKYKLVRTRLDIELGTGLTASHWKRKYEEAQAKLNTQNDAIRKTVLELDWSKLQLQQTYENLEPIDNMLSTGFGLCRNNGDCAKERVRITSISSRLSREAEKLAELLKS